MKPFLCYLNVIQVGYICCQTQTYYIQNNLKVLLYLICKSQLRDVFAFPILINSTQTFDTPPIPRYLLETLYNEHFRGFQKSFSNPVIV